MMKRKCLLMTLSLSFFLVTKLSAIVTNWQGGISNDMLDPANWSAGIPTSADTGFFSIGASTFSPTINGGGVLNGVTAGDFFFQGGPPFFNFQISNVGLLAFTGAGINSTAVLPNFLFTGASQSSFSNNASAGGGIFNLTAGSIQNFNQNSNAGVASIAAFSTALVQFHDFSNGGTFSSLLADAGTINFLDNSSASGSLINGQNNGLLQFFGNSSAGNATINFNGASINFFNASNAENATINLQGSTLISQLTPGANLFIGSLTANAASTISLRNGNALVLGGQGNNTTVDAPIINGGGGGGSLVKIGGGVLTLTNAGNTYNLGTVVSGGTLALSGAGSLLPTAHVNVNAAGAVFSISGITPASINIGDLSGIAGSLIDLGSKGLIVNSSTTTTCASEITGAGGSLTKQGPGTLILDGPNNYSGGTNVLNGILQGNSTSLQGQILNDAILTFNQTTDGTFNGTLLGSGLINKDGLGTLNLVTNNSAFGGITSVNQGRLSLNSVLGGSVVVQLAGILSGNGTVGNNLIVNGIVSPGNSIGTIVVNGNYVQNAGSIYNVQFNGAGQSSLLNILGSAALNPGAGVNFMSLDGIINPNVTYLILHADGGVIGTYTNVTSSNPMIRPFLTYDPNNVFVNFTRSVASVAATRNQRAVALQLDSLTDPDPAEEILLMALTSLSVPEAQKVLDELSAQQYTNLLMTSELANRQFIRRMFNAIRPSLVYDPCACTCDSLGKYNVWVESGYGMDQYKKKDTIRGFKNKHYDITCGVQARPIDFLTVGTAFSYEHAQMHYNLSASGRSHNFFGGLYSLYRPKCYYAFGEFAVGYSVEKIRRRVNVGPVLSYRPHSNPKVIQTGLYLEAGRDYNFFCTHIQPFVGFEFGYHYLHHFHEHGAYPINLSVHSRSQDNADGRLGFHITPENQWNILMSMDIAWQYRFTKFKNKIRESFLAFGDSFTIFGSPWARNSIEAAFSLYAPFCECWEVFVEADGAWWKRINTYSVMGGIGLNW